ncbi:MAG: hypothetical protein V1898_00135 [Patescibacteria group bacterium]
MKLKDYLNNINKLLSIAPEQKQKVISEIKDHLNDEQKRLMLNGKNENEALSTAINEFGLAHLVAVRFNKVYANFWNSVPVIIGGLLIILFIVRSIFFWFICVNKQISDFHSGGLLIGPGTNDRLICFFALILAILFSLSLAKVASQYLSRLIVSPKKLSLYFSITAISISLGYLAFSLLQLGLALSPSLNLDGADYLFYMLDYPEYILLNVAWILFSTLIFGFTAGSYFYWFYYKSVNKYLTT